MRPLRLLFALALSLLVSSKLVAQKRTDYQAYHQDVLQAEELLARQQYAQALALLEHTIESYDYMFLREYKVATQLALYLADYPKAFTLLRGSIRAGWTLQEMKKSRWLVPLRNAKSDWQSFQLQYSNLRTAYEKSVQQNLRAEVRAMARKDQQLTFVALLQPGKRARERFLTRKFLPHSERQLATLTTMLHQQGYPGEKLIGTGSWMARILSHHNSMSPSYTQQDTLYPQLQPLLLNALQRGEMAPAEYAVIEEWYLTIRSSGQEAGYGYLNPLTEHEILVANRRRARIGLRSVELRNQLITVQEQTGMDLLVDGIFWVKGRTPLVVTR
jgi:hypothetical protein